MSAKHTKGPFRVETYCIYANHAARAEFPIHATKCGLIGKAYKHSDAVLFSAAPDLLEAAKMGHSDSPGLPAGDLLAAANVLRNSGHDELAERLEHKHAAEQAAIAKATGSEQ